MQTSHIFFSGEEKVLTPAHFLFKRKKSAYPRTFSFQAKKKCISPHIPFFRNKKSAQPAPFISGQQWS
jgi:hypothetical protein